jgi:hypothetical protein
MIPEQEINDIVDVIENVLKHLNADDEKGVKKWSDHIIHSASIFQDKYSVQLATAVYSIGKTMANHYSRRKWPDKYKTTIKTIESLLKKALEFARQKKIDEYYKIMVELLSLIGKYNKRFGQYLEEVIRYAMIKKGSRMYEHGISMGRVAEILGISEWELMERTGWLGERDFPKIPIMPVEKRQDDAKELFG